MPAALPDFPSLDEDDNEKDERFFQWLDELFPDDAPEPSDDDDLPFTELLTED